MSGIVAETRVVESFDGTQIAGYRLPGPGGPPILLVNAIGPDLSAWRRVIDEVAAQRPLLAWDYRGLHRSAEPLSPRLDAVAHAKDAMAVADASGADRFDVAAWSTGTRVAVEIARRYPERVGSVLIVCGGFGRGFRGLFRYFEISSLFPLGARFGKRFAPSLQAPFRAFVERPEIAGVVRQSGIIGPTADVDALVDVLKSLAACDLRALLQIYEEVVGDADPSVLSEVLARVLVVAGRRDKFTTLGMADEMTRRLPNAEKVVYDKGTHFVPIEYPQRLVADMLGFFQLER
ncbi:MAG: alpha/beta hydrolase [Actinobacteria bacterium]|nr:alpha/beta hydrolase [Actinomycetota bacterium]